MLLALCVLITVALQAQETLTPELLWKFKRVGSPVVSPDGKQFVYPVSNYDLKENKGNTDLYLLDAKGGTPVQLTSLTGSEFNAVWRADGKKIGFLATRDGAPQLFEINPDGSGLAKLTEMEEGIANFSYSPVGTHIMYTRRVKTQSTVQDKYPDLPKANARIIDDLMYRHWDKWSDYKSSHVFITGYAEGTIAGEGIDIMQGQKFDAPLRPFGGAGELDWSADGRMVAYTSKKVTGKEYAESTNSDIFLYNMITQKTTNISEGMEGYDKDPLFSPDGGKMLWMSMETPGYESDRNRIFVYDFETGTKEELTAGWDYSATSPAWSEDGKTVYFLAVINATEQIFSVDLKNKKIQQLTEGIHDYVSVAPAGKRLIATKRSMSMPNEIFSVNPKNGKDEQLTFTNKDMLDNMKMGTVEKRMITSNDGEQVLTWVIYPPDFDPAKKYPALLYAQGGPQSPVSQFFSYRWNFQLMAANGYIVVAPNRRGLPGFGTKWNEQISGDWGGQAMQDLLAAIDQVAKEPFVDEERLGAIGASFGGYSVYWLAGNHDDRFKTFISHAGLYNLESWYASTEEMFFANYDVKGAPWDSPQAKSYELFSPHKFAGNWDTPILVIHGEKDFRVPINQGIEAFHAAQLQGIPSRFLYFPEEGHWILNPQNGVLWHRVFFEWLDEYLK